MQLKNRQKNNFFYVDDAVMRGTIEMTSQEWQKCYLWLWGQYQKAIKDIETYKRDSLASLKKDKGRIFCIGVLATQLIVKKYKLKNYRDVNYAIIIK